MISQKPFLIRAIYEWCKENEFTPYMAVRVDHNTNVPMQYVQDGQIVLNVAQEATKNFFISNSTVGFKATFHNVVYDIEIPIANILAIFAKENGQGMSFNLENPPPEVQSEIKSSLKLVK